MTGKVLITGASGYIGGRLLVDLVNRGYDVVSMVRRPNQFQQQVQVRHDIRYGDTYDIDSLHDAFDGIDIVFYLVHSLSQGRDFVSKELISIDNVITVAEQKQVSRIIYLGGLFKEGEVLSAHLDSRKQVGDRIRQSRIPSITFRASIILGSGSISYEMIRHLTERLPIMITPKWVRVRAQPIAISDVIQYLRMAIDVPITDHNYDVYEIGGADVVSYKDIMLAYAKLRGLKRLILPLNVLTPTVSSYWVALFSPIYQTICKKLILSMRNSTIVTDIEKTMAVFKVQPMSMIAAIARAIECEEQQFVKTHWASSYSSSNYVNQWLEMVVGNKLIYVKKITVDCNLQDAFHPIQTIGGQNGWYYGSILWQVRGIIDIFLGGPGHKRGRKHPTHLSAGDFLDWWRVEQVNPPHILRLRAEMKLPGRAWLEFELRQVKKNQSAVFVSAIFEPAGMVGRVYWYLLYPVHFFMFNGLLRSIKKIAETSKA